MDWYDIDDILIDGTKEYISDVVCPDCEAKIKYCYSQNENSMEITCEKCGYISRASGYPFPNCVKYFLITRLIYLCLTESEAVLSLLNFLL